MSKHQDSLDRILSYAYMYLAYRDDATQKELENYVRGILIDKRMIEELIKKATPKKPLTYKQKSHGKECLCPNCENLIYSSNSEDYCSNCGQAIDWSTHG